MAHLKKSANSLWLFWYACIYSTFVYVYVTCACRYTWMSTEAHFACLSPCFLKLGLLNLELSLELIHWVRLVGHELQGSTPLCATPLSEPGLRKCAPACLGSTSRRKYHYHPNSSFSSSFPLSCVKDSKQFSHCKKVSGVGGNYVLLRKSR